MPRARPSKSETRRRTAQGPEAPAADVARIVATLSIGIFPTSLPGCLLRVVLPSPTTLEAVCASIVGVQYLFRNVTMVARWPDILKAIKKCEEDVAAGKLGYPGVSPLHSAVIALWSSDAVYPPANHLSRDEGRTLATLAPVLPFLALLCEALRALPPALHYKGPAIRCERSVHPQTTTKYAVGRTFYTTAMTSTDKGSTSVTSFLGESGERTVFQYEEVEGYAIKNFSLYKSEEDEVLVIPCAQFEVTGHHVIDASLEGVIRAALKAPAPSGGTGAGSGTIIGVHFITLRHMPSKDAPLDRDSATRDKKAADAVAGKIIVVGGRDGSKALSTCFVLNCATGVWTTMAPMPSGRLYHGVAMHGGMIYVVGGSEDRKSVV